MNRAIVSCGLILALSLFVIWVFWANYYNPAVAFHDFAVVAHWFY